jgi:hypothetical protein
MQSALPRRYSGWSAACRDPCGKALPGSALPGATKEPGYASAAQREAEPLNMILRSGEAEPG